MNPSILKGAVYVQIFTRENIDTLLSPNFSFETKWIRTSSYTDEMIEMATQIGDYVIQPPDKNNWREWYDALVGYKTLFDDKPLLETIIIGRGEKKYQDSFLPPIIYELYVFSDGMIELFIVETQVIRFLLNNYQFKYSYQPRFYEQGINYIGLPDQRSTTINFLHVTDLRPIDDVFLDKIMKNVYYYYKTINTEGYYEWKVVPNDFIYMIKLPLKI